MAALGSLARREARVLGLALWRGGVRLVDSSALTHAASIAYFALLSLFPFLLLVVSALGALTTDPTVRAAVVDFVFQYFPRQFDFIAGQLEAFEHETLTLSLGGAIALVWAALGVFNAVSAGINHAWRVERPRGFVAHRLISFLMMLSAGVALLGALLLTSAIRVARAQWFEPVIERAPWLLWLSSTAATYAAAALLVLGVALVFYFIPATRVRFVDVWPGAIATGLLWQAALWAFSWYAADLARWSVHGSIASVVVFLFWVYICAAILIYGACVTASHARLREAADAARTSGPGP